MKKFGSRLPPLVTRKVCLAVEGDERVVAVGILQIDVIKSGPAQAAVNGEGAQVGGGRVGVHHARVSVPLEADVGREAADHPIGPVGPVARVIHPFAAVERVDAVIDPVRFEKVFAQVISRRGGPHRVTGAIRAGAATRVMLIHPSMPTFRSSSWDRRWHCKGRDYQYTFRC